MQTFTLTEEPIVQGHRGGRTRGGRRKPGQYGKTGGVVRSNIKPQAGHTRGNAEKDLDPSDGNGSLSYSASSSVQSSAGESTDSSFAEILHVLDMGEDAELMHLVSRGDDPNNQHPFKSAADIQCRSAFSNEANFCYNKSAGHPSSSRSGRPRPQTFTGQTSGSLGSDNPTFAPSNSQSQNNHSSRKSYTLENKTSPHFKPEIYQQLNKKIGIRSSRTSSSPAPRPRNSKLEHDDDPSSNRQLWYSQWWMCGFTDALNLNE